MKKTITPTPTPPARRRGGKILPIAAVAVLLLAILVYVLPLGHRETEGDNSTPTSPKPEVTVNEQFREDGILTFLAPDGTQKAGISIEIAETDAARMQGMMGRTAMREDRGMLFLFDESEQRSFWMANTPLPLDILFVGPDGRIVKIHQNTVPFSEESLLSEQPAQYVVEVNAGYTQRHGLAEGDKIVWMRSR